jgi:hypothetical protein
MSAKGGKVDFVGIVVLAHLSQNYMKAEYSKKPIKAPF